MGKATNNGSYGHLSAHSVAANISYPLTFSIQNNPISDFMVLTISNPSSKAKSALFVAMDTEQSLDIYLSAANQGNNLNLNYFNLLHSIPEHTNYHNPPNPESTNMATTRATNKAQIKSSDSEWIESVFVTILMVTIFILYCLCIIFGVMFSKMCHHHNKEKEMDANIKKIQHEKRKNSQQSAESDKTKTMEIFLDIPDISKDRMCPSNTSSITTMTNPTLNEILSALSPISGRMEDVLEEKEEDILKEIHDDMINEDLYDPPKEEDIRRATMRSSTPGQFGSELKIDDDVNRISIVDLHALIPPEFKLKLSLDDVKSGDSEALYDAVCEQEGTPFGSTDTVRSNDTITPFPVRGTL